MIETPKVSDSDVAAAESWAKRLPDAAPGVETPPAIHLKPNKFDDYNVDDTQWIESLKNLRDIPK